MENSEQPKKLSWRFAILASVVLLTLGALVSHRNTGNVPVNSFVKENAIKKRVVRTDVSTKSAGMRIQRSRTASDKALQRCAAHVYESILTNNDEPWSNVQRGLPWAKHAKYFTQGAEQGVPIERWIETKAKESETDEAELGDMRGEHKVVSFGSRGGGLWYDKSNLVVAVDAFPCQIIGVYESTPAGQMHPAIAHDVQSGLVMVGSDGCFKKCKKRGKCGGTCWACGWRKYCN